MDSFKLVRPSAVLVAVVAGAVAALVCLLLHAQITDAGLSAATPRPYGAPVTEDAAKAAFVGLLIARHRIAILVRAAILGSAGAAGFARPDNVAYLQPIPTA